MSNPSMYALTLFAQAAQGGGAAGGGSGGDPFSLPILLIALLVPFYFVVLRPAQKQDKERKAMVAALKKGDRVVTVGGMIGTVAQIEEKGVGDEDIVTLKIDDKVKIPVLKSSVHRVVNRPDASAAATSEVKETSGK